MPRNPFALRTPARRTPVLRTLAAFAATAAMFALAGCGVAMDSLPTTFTHALTLEGQVFAGRNYMAGATVKLYVTQPTGVATNGKYVGQAKLLQTLTASNTGTWSISGFTCTSPDQLYVTAEGGTPYPSGFNVTTLSPNPNSVMMTAVGDCAQLTNATATNNVTTVVTNEGSTVAAVWAMRNFISLNGTTVNITSSATNYAGTNGVGVVGNYAGLAHAFLNTLAIMPANNGNFLQYTHGAADGTTGALVPVQELNALAYAQYLCTIGGPGGAGDFSYCSTLYSLATPPGGTAPTNSMQAMLNIATYPTNNSDAILAFTLNPIPGTTQTGSQQINAGVYVPALTSFGTLTDDWTVALLYLPGIGTTAAGQGQIVPANVSIDANDDVFLSNWATSTGGSGNIVALTSSGQSLWSSNTDSTNLVLPRGVAADSFGNVWAVNGTTTAGAGLVQQFNAATGALIATYPSTSAGLYGITADPVGNVWYTVNSATGQNLHEIARTGTTYAEAAFATAPNVPYQLLQVRTDKNNNIWAGAYLSAGGAAAFFPNTGTVAAPAFTAPMQTAAIGGASSTYGITVDASGNAYAVANSTTATSSNVYKITPTGTGASASIAATAVATNPAAASRLMDTDGAGSIWYIDATTGSKLYQYIPSSGATPTGYYPCYASTTNTGTGTATSTVQTCSTSISSRTDLTIDSTGSVWVPSYGSSVLARTAQILGLAAPTVPLHSLGLAGNMP